MTSNGTETTEIEDDVADDAQSRKENSHRQNSGVSHLDTMLEVKYVMF